MSGIYKGPDGTDLYGDGREVKAWTDVPKRVAPSAETRMVPNPGSDAALAMGCKCPIIDNGHGRGCGEVGREGQPLFWRSEECTVHSPAATNCCTATEVEAARKEEQ